MQTETAQTSAAHRTALQGLLALNGNLPLTFDADTYPRMEELNDANALYDEVMATDAALLEADANARAAEQELKVNRQSWLPKLEVGYRRNTSLDEKKFPSLFQPQEDPHRPCPSRECPSGCRRCPPESGIGGA